MDLGIRTKATLIVTAVCSLAIAATLSVLTDEAKATYGATWCESQKGKSDNWKSGCESGAADCRGGKAYDPGSGHSRDFHHGYDAGWSHSGCK
ncbi:MAG: hypothetical protein GEU26_07580 [Nitrososphaeraceae archaeon]|nr:hypothetical protein [Nitrososphaeraceae archaeon]